MSLLIIYSWEQVKIKTNNGENIVKKEKKTEMRSRRSNEVEKKTKLNEACISIDKNNDPTYACPFFLHKK